MAKSRSNCEECMNFSYNEFYDCWECDISMDEDELVRLECDTHYNCPYYRPGDEYTIVRKQN